MLGHIFFTNDFDRSFKHLLEKDVTPVYNYEFKFDGELNMCKKLMFATRPKLLSLKGKTFFSSTNIHLFYMIIIIIVFLHMFDKIITFRCLPCR